MEVVRVVWKITSFFVRCEMNELYVNKLETIHLMADQEGSGWLPTNCYLNKWALSGLDIFAHCRWG